MPYLARLLISIALLASTGLLAQPINPEGLYQNVFSGGVSGLEAVLIRPVADQQNQYTISNISGRGVTAAISPDGQITVAPFGAVGSFSSADTAQFSLPQSQPSNYQLTRIALTDSDFLTYNGEAFPANPRYSGDWDITERVFDPVTGVEQPPPFILTSTLSGEISNDGIPALRSTEFQNGALNGFFQGVLDSQRSWIVQIGDPAFIQVDPALAMQNLPGVQTSFSVRFVGKGQFQDINTFTNTVLVENRQDAPPPPQLKLFLFQQTLLRQQPLVPGDFDGDGGIGAADRAQIMALYGLDDFQTGYDLLADIDTNGVIDLRDSAALDDNNTQLTTIEAGFSGSWFNPARSGEGWNIAILPGNRAIIAFFSFAPDGSTQAWIVGTGQVVDNVIVFSDLNITSGASFGDAFDPNDVVRSQWGNIRIYFTDCNNGAISYGAEPPFGNNARPISRLTTLAGIGCGQSAPVLTASQTVTGTWFAPARDGEGIIFEALTDGRVVMYWYTYDSEGGNQYWLGGVGQFDAATNTVQFDMLRTSTGTAFGDDFVSADLVQIPWGSGSFQQLDCNNGVLSFNSTLPGFDSGNYTLTRLTGVTGLACDPNQFTQ